MEDENIVGHGGAPHACASYEISNLQRRVRELEEHILHRSTETRCTVPIAGRLSCQHSSLPHLPQSLLHVQASYLDSDILSAWNPPAQSIHEPVPEEIAKLLGSRSDIDLIKARYFQSVHVWMPIISKIRLDRLADRSLGTIRADIALLYLCMKLVQEVPPPQQEGQSELYIVAKQFLNDLHMKGPLTLRIVQAGLLLSIYELGHAIFPSAFMTIGHCARGGIAMGLHNRLAPQLAGKPRSWADWEERLRVWWMTVILDRYVTVGADYRPLCTEDPNNDTLLPADDSAWDNGNKAQSVPLPA
ncbi:fungal specific transcription factor domain-containing protein [Aspergillus udagawae]|uniref:Xylanolytic transcriptional activator regulatory domain-containing protein n=1 Tax=Aspergillus udagawae TaxID=91492 RepID=A0A8E0R1L8_9EURO|nr:uncharacterized protein Aud_009440 [Aspergillus udagawae]GIC92961.1 hypothetical protein Aud_009440 [Aspergillus udagawae]